MKFLITGGCGFLGSNLSSEVLRQGEDLFIMDNLSRSGSANNLDWLQKKGSFKFYHSDIRSSNDVDLVIRDIKPDFIFHLAGQVAMSTSIANPRIDFEINALGSFNIIDAVRKYSPNTTIIYSSTNKVYGDLEWMNYKETKTRYITPDYVNGYPESIPLSFQSPYGNSKGSADQYMQDFYRVYGIKTVVFRHSSMYGGRQFATFDQGWIGWFCQQAVATQRGVLKDPFTIAGSGKQVRDVLHADDMINLYFSTVKNIDKVVGQVFNIGGGIENSLSLLELFELLEEIVGVKLNFTSLGPRQSDQKVFVAGITKINELIDWRPGVDTKTGLKRMVEWVSSTM
jgi:CDP-paratose 2-epimerase